MSTVSSHYKSCKVCEVEKPLTKYHPARGECFLCYRQRLFEYCCRPEAKQRMYELNHIKGQCYICGLALLRKNVMQHIRKHSNPTPQVSN